MNSRLTIRQWLLLATLGVFALSAWSWLIAQAVDVALHRDRHAWGFVALFALLAASALTAVVKARSRIAMFNAESEVLNREISLERQRRVAQA